MLKRFERIFIAAVFFAFAGYVYMQGQSAPSALVLSVPFTDNNTFTDTGTVTANQLVQGLLKGTPTGAATYTTDTAANLCAAFPQVGSTGNQPAAYDLYIKNTSAGANTITMAGGAGVTLVGTGTTAQNFVRHFKVALTECRAGQTAAVRLYSLETTAF